ncbi:Threonylcarbamoyladenosine tRNA methylthiotransferase MtaB [Meiothermus luteus]|jgi:threonylcarbamoyladenosine tRNA methylthiotransferase MtaB|uniref:Threonylcarbamoyladenosine tRNA methylthiotransferase MtaB n=1 Tax=Meiothermus luteus TaxID=2026184 RepID=A0A399EUL1_9DEIN|nr:MiaB/RimO family radical SAM methylthiotransferase [Meiothermus luteus]RIH87315.1 Threonylcarbamoyladenosine tRNA methylthiotransferase MtaB [Meiothermus luteus]RMH53618.1 MAG: MiaB/RimO family radical SAM methylthiotransferase [Deinococcota bacterium]
MPLVEGLRLAVRTLGCKVNQVESDALVGLLGALNPKVVPVEAGADLVVINTCAVTTGAEADARKEVRRARRANPEAFIVVTGCYAELAPEQVAELGADVVVPNRRKAELPGIILQRFGLPADPLTTPPNAFWGAGERGLLNDYVRAFVKVQDGCNAGCAYCIIPRLRGRERHRPYQEALREAEALLAAGVQEIVLTGIRLGSYRGHPRGIAGLVEALAQMGARVRLSSIEPEDTGEELLQVLHRYAPQVRPHLHLSLQTASDRLLALMGRRYSKAYYRALVERAYALVPGFALTTDVIAGLPTETEAEHRETLAFLEELRPSRVHVFTYTPRPKTRAASMPQVPVEVRKRRNQELTALARRLAEERVRPLLGGRVEVLVESFRGDRAYGHTPDYYEAELVGAARVGQTVWARVEGVSGYTLRGFVEGLKEEPYPPLRLSAR